MARHAATYLSAAAGAVFAAVFAPSPAATAALRQHVPDPVHCAVNTLENVDFSNFETTETSLIHPEDGETVISQTALNAFGEQASVVITFSADEILAKAFHPGKPNFENDDFWAMEIIRLKNGMLEYQWPTFKPDPPEGLIHRDLTQRRWALDTSRKVADELRTCLDLKKETPPSSKPPVRTYEPLDRTTELEQR